MNHPAPRPDLEGVGLKTIFTRITFRAATAAGPAARDRTPGLHQTKCALGVSGPQKRRCHTHQPRFFIAAKTVSGVIGSFLTLIPMAEQTAFATAGAVGGTGGSPTPPILSPMAIR